MPTHSDSRLPPRVTLTGATGFIGRHIVEALLARGIGVGVLARGVVPSAWEGRVEVFRGGLGDDAAIDAAVAWGDAVCHAAGYVPARLADASEAAACFEVNALGTMRLAARAKDHRKRLVALSSGQVYTPGPGAAAEDAPTYPAWRAPYYLTSKLAGEIFVEHLRAGADWPAYVLRVGSCYGPGMPEGGVVARFMTRARAGERLEVQDGGEATSDLIFVGDVVAMCLRALSGGDAGVYNCGTGVGRSVRELAEIVARAHADRGATVDVQPRRGAPPVSFRALAIDKARAAWGFAPQPLEGGIALFRRALDG